MMVKADTAAQAFWKDNRCNTRPGEQIRFFTPEEAKAVVDGFSSSVPRCLDKPSFACDVATVLCNHKVVEDARGISSKRETPDAASLTSRQLAPSSNRPDSDMSLWKRLVGGDEKRDPRLGPIPHIIWFTSKSQELRIELADNVQRTIDVYRKAWNEPLAPARVVTDGECLSQLRQSMPNLIVHFLNEPLGMYKADMCRLAVLYVG
jgi:hypothetical protein